jgi:hypothetical protein
MYVQGHFTLVAQDIIRYHDLQKSGVGATSENLYVGGI